MDNVPKIIVGNKTDQWEFRIVKSREAFELANRFNLQYFEVSAKKGSGIDEMMEYIMEKVY